MTSLFTLAILGIHALSYADSPATTTVIKALRPATNSHLEKAVTLIEKAALLEGKEREALLKTAREVISPSLQPRTYNAAIYVRHGLKAPEQQFLAREDESNYRYVHTACFVGEQSEAISLLNEAVTETEQFWTSRVRINRDESVSAEFEQFTALDAKSILATYTLFDTHGHELGKEKKIITKCNE
jgi:hypothetical protein